MWDVSKNFALNSPRQRDVKLNELPKQIFMRLPVLLLWLSRFIFSFCGSLGPGAPSGPHKNEKIKPMKQQRQQHKNLLWQFIQINIPLPLDVKGLNIPLTP